MSTAVAPANGNGSGKWTLYIGLAAFLLSVGGGVIQLGALTQTVAQQAERIASLEQKAGKSIEDRAELRSDFEGYRRQTDGKLMEIETQFSAMNSFQNVEVAQRRQYDGIFFAKLFGQELPSNEFYPTLHHEEMKMGP